MAWYIDRAYYSYGQYYVDGQEMPYCTRSGSKRDLGSNTSHGYLAALGTIRCYVTESVLTTFQASSEWGVLKPRILGIVPNDYAQKYNRGGAWPWCWGLKEGVVPKPLPSDDPCKDVSCPDKCVGVDKYDQVCQDGICVRGTLIETSSVHCGYTPDPTPDPTPTPPSDTYIIIALMLAGTYMILR
jgi:hypothetical protein